MVKDLDSALRFIAEERSKGLKPSPLPASRDATREPLASDQAQKYVDELLHFLGSIDWESDGFDCRAEVDPAHPFMSVFDAIALLKNDLDDLLQERKRAQEDKEKLQVQLLQFEKMASVGQLAAGVAHEINNPTGFISSNFNTLKGYQADIARLLRLYKKLIADLRDAIAKENLPSSIAKQVEEIVDLETEADIDFVLNDIPALIEDSMEGTERIKKIVLDLKDFAHPGEDKLSFSDINKGLDSTLNVVWNELKYKATVTKDYGDIPLIPCYPQRLNQVFMNILVNAAQAIEKQGEIKISTRALDGYAEIKISDTGLGISKENLSKIFDPFFTSKEVGKGTGLGLNVAYNIIKKHKGSIDVQSTVGKGTTFTIRIPVSEAGEG
jgi:signal transduction histidine kinase